MDVNSNVIQPNDDILVKCSFDVKLNNIYFDTHLLHILVKLLIWINLSYQVLQFLLGKNLKKTEEMYSQVVQSRSQIGF